MMIRKTTYAAASLISRLHRPIISHKFYFGQGGELNFDLSKRNYHINVQTFWEDHSLLEIEGLTGANNFTIYEQQGVSYFRDEELQAKQDENITVSLKIPEDYTLRGTLSGSLAHASGEVGKKIRSKPFSLEIVGENRLMQLGDLKSEDVNLANLKGTISVPSLTVQTGRISSQHFKSQKLMTSSSIDIRSETVNLRSIIMFGKSQGTITAKDVEIQSISGDSLISSETIKIERYYGGQNSININCKTIRDKLGIQTGTGKVQFPTEQQAIEGQTKIVLGRMHKGRLDRKANVILIC